MSDTATFFRAWMSNPLRTASIVPSGRALGEAMTREIGVAQAPVIELGPGTGVFTRQLIVRGVPEERIALVESASSFAGMLRLQFPSAVMLETDATELRRCDPFEGEKVGAVISGLPLLSMPAWRVLAILHGAFRILRPEGALYQFTYGWRCPVRRHILDRLDLEATCIDRVFANVPPAQVYRIARRPSVIGMG
jgi:phosphatidylethanolamine/phosphatidyl-N-methylethanolamine N-methyltransferase